ncbi:hypothetical protein [Mycobacteroides saopaulense]|uniref:hypothetical protein n=1 Tax=Mycobacteroides saopaulense TaxID=1578165 RepID=UPI001F43F8C3|nr:hypothetical protein [Mycobacteroides saopaulense]
MTRSREEFDSVRFLIEAGLNDCAISLRTGIPRRTVCQWRRHPIPMRIEHANDCTKHNFTTLPAGRYAYLLGMYLGDGYISRSPHGDYE